MSAAPWHVDTESPEDESPSHKEAVIIVATGFAWTAILWSLSVLIAGCSMMVEVDHYSDYRYPCPYAASDILVAEAVLLDEWNEQFGEDVVGLTEGLRVQCVPGLWSVQGVDGQISGQTYDKRTIRIAYAGGNRDGIWPLRYTALTHELIHVVLWRRDGDPDDAHESEYWSLESTTRARLYGDEELGCAVNPIGT